MEKINGGVGFFDSGIGGLTVLAECRKRINDEIFYYYGDNEHAPYGNLPAEAIKKFVFSAFDTFAALKVKAAVVACNTATAVCVEALRKKYPFPIVGAEPAVLPAVKRGGKVFVLTTRATYESNRFRALCSRIRQKYPNADIQPHACDLLAGTIEERLFDASFDYTPFLPQGSPDAVVLGCTHYIYLKDRLRAFYGCEIFDGNEGMANRLVAFLDQINVKAREDGPLLSTAAKISPIFFLGSQKNTNERVFEHMFAKTSGFCNKSG
ncbi:MAG: glutamate racemase [Clostridia bacterium]|nr:glutamate racemase [Clostridia bacterium]